MKWQITALNLLLFSSLVSMAQGPSWMWAKGAGGADNETVCSMSTDLQGNVYVAGSFRSISVVFGTTTLYSNTPQPDLFLVKYDANGNVIWAKNAEGIISDNALSSTTDISGNTYVAGAFLSSTITFDSITLNQDSAGTDIFLAKYDSNGNVLWAKRAGGTGLDEAGSVTTDASGNIFMCGRFASSPFVFGSDTLFSNPYYSMFLVKYDSNGNELWAKSKGGNYSDEARSVTTDVFGNIYVAGKLQSTSLFFGNDTLINVGQRDAILLRYDVNGNEIWAKSAGSALEDNANSVVSDTMGNVYVAGWFKGPVITFDSITLNNNTAGYDDIFIAKFDSNGNVQWANSAGGNRHDEARSVCIDVTGKIYLTGLFESPSIVFGTVTLTKPGIYDAEVFLVGYDENGSALWAKKANGNGYDWGRSVVTDYFGNIFIGGYFSGPSLSCGSVILNNAAGGITTDMFVAKLAASVGIDEINDESSVLLFPNPTNKNFTIVVPPSTKKIEISNLFGQMMQTKIVDRETYLDFTIENEGIYFIQITTGNQRIIKRITVCR